MIFLIGLIAVLLLMLYDYLHDKVSWSLKTTWPKYVVALVAAWFYGILQTITFFQYVQEAGVVILAGLFAALIFKWLSTAWVWVKNIVKR